MERCHIHEAVRNIQACRHRGDSRYNKKECTGGVTCGVTKAGARRTECIHGAWSHACMKPSVRQVLAGEQVADYEYWMTVRVEGLLRRGHAETQLRVLHVWSLHPTGILLSG